MRKKTFSVDDVNYSHYLGPDYKKDASKIGQNGTVSKYIAPHISCFDPNVCAVAFDGDVSFVAGAFIKKVPGFGKIAEMLGSVFVKRAGTKEQKEEVINTLSQRTELIEKKGTFPPLLIFPEGTCSNGTCLLTFRRGAFMDQRALIPVTLKY